MNFISTNVANVVPPFCVEGFSIVKPEGASPDAWRQELAGKPAYVRGLGASLELVLSLLTVDTSLFNNMLS